MTTMNLSTESSQAANDAVKAKMNGGTLVMYSGVQPANADTALSSNTVLATFAFSATAFGTDSVVSGTEQATASFVSTTVTPTANGTATFARCFKSDGTSPVMDIPVATSGANTVVIGNTALVTTNPVGPIALTLGEPVH